LRSQKLKRIMRWLIKRVLFNVKSVQVSGTGKNPRIKRDGVLSESVLMRFYCITLIEIVPSHYKKFVKSYEFDLIFITEYLFLFFLIQLSKMHFKIIIIIVFLVT
jgi:hypothetical protein